MDWFIKHFLKGNADKCHLITSSKLLWKSRCLNITEIIDDKVKSLRIYISNRLNFHCHISQLFKKAGKKVYVLTRVFKYINILQCKLIANGFIMSQFSHCLLIWISNSRAMEHRINRIHDKALKLIYQNQTQLTFTVLFQENKIVSIHQRNVKTLETQI